MVAIKSKGGDSWHYVPGVVLDGNSIKSQFSFDKGKPSLQQVNLEVIGKWYRRIG